MSYDNFSVVDCDSHIVESVPEMAEYMSNRIKQQALKPARNRQGIFPSLDGMHFAWHEENAKTRKRITASEYRPGSDEDWLAFPDRAERDENYFDPGDQPGNRLRDYLRRGRILLGCEGSEHTIAYLAKRVGVECFAYASDYLREVDLPSAQHEIEDVAEREDLTVQQRQSILADNARRFFNL